MCTVNGRFLPAVEYITSAPVVVMALEGSDAIMAADIHRGDQTGGGGHHITIGRNGTRVG